MIKKSEWQTRSWNEQDLQAKVLNLKPSATLWINERSAQLASEGHMIYRLGLGQSPFPVPNEVVTALIEYAQEKDYLPVRGLPELRQAVCDRIKRFENLERSAQNVIIGPGSKELIYMVQMSLKARLILPSPSWVSYAPQASLTDRKVSWINTTWQEGLRLNAKHLEEACSAHQGERLILVLNTPNNPSGVTYDESELRSFADVFRRYSVLVISDEIYSETHFQGAHISIARYYPEGTLISNGISKWAGAGGWRLGWLSAPTELTWLIEAMGKIASETFTAVSAPIQYAAISATKDTPTLSSYLLACQKILGELSCQAVERLHKVEVKVCESNGGFYLFISLEAHREKLTLRKVDSGSTLAQALLNEIGVASLEGAHFGRTPEELSLRLALVDFDGAKAIDAVNDPTYISDSRLSEVVHSHCTKVITAIDLICEWIKTHAL